MSILWPSCWTSAVLREHCALLPTDGFRCLCIYLANYFVCFPVSDTWKQLWTPASPRKNTIPNFRFYLPVHRSQSTPTPIQASWSISWGTLIRWVKLYCASQKGVSEGDCENRRRLFKRAHAPSNFPKVKTAASSFFIFSNGFHMILGTYFFVCYAR